MTKHRSTMAMIVADGINLTTLIRWCGRHHGLISLSRDYTSSGGGVYLWRIIVMRAPEKAREDHVRGVVFNEQDPDISEIFERAAKAVRKTPEWALGHNAESARKSRRKRKQALDEGDDDGTARKAQEKVGDGPAWDIWKKELAEKPPLSSTGHAIRDKRFTPEAAMEEWRQQEGLGE